MVTLSALFNDFSYEIPKMSSIISRYLVTIAQRAPGVSCTGTGGRAALVRGCEREREIVCVCVSLCVCEREREREKVCVCVCVQGIIYFLKIV